MHKYRARSVGVPPLPSDFLRSSRPSRSYVQGFLPPCVRFRPGRRYRPRAHRARSTGRQLGKPNSILEQKVAKDAKSAQIPSPIGWRPSPPLGFSPNFAPFAILCSRFSPPMRPIPTWSSVPPSSTFRGARLQQGDNLKTEFHFGTEGREGREECTIPSPIGWRPSPPPRIFSELRAAPSRPYVQSFLPPCVRFRPGRRYRPRAHRARSTGRQLENRIPFLNRRSRRTQRVHKYRARSVGVPRLPSDSLRTSRPSRSYVQGFLPHVRGRRYTLERTERAQQGDSLGEEATHSILEQKVAKDAKIAQKPSPIRWRPSPPLGFSPNFALFAILCSRFSPPMFAVVGTTLERTERAPRGDSLENRIPFMNRRTRRTQRVHKYRARLVGVPRLPSDFLRTSRPSRSYVQGFLPHVRGFPARLARASEIRSASRTTCTFNSRSSLPSDRLPLCPCDFLLPMLNGCLRRRERDATFHRRA